MTLQSPRAPVLGSSETRRRIQRRVRPTRSRRRSGLRVALLAPPWIPVPPPGYGGIELVIAELAGGLVRRGHDVALLAPPGSRSTAEVIPLLERDHSNEIGETLYDVDHTWLGRLR